MWLRKDAIFSKRRFEVYSFDNSKTTIKLAKSWLKRKFKGKFESVEYV